MESTMRQWRSLGKTRQSGGLRLDVGGFKMARLFSSVFYWPSRKGALSYPAPKRTVRPLFYYYMLKISLGKNPHLRCLPHCLMVWRGSGTHSPTALKTQCNDSESSILFWACPCRSWLCVDQLVWPVELSVLTSPPVRWYAMLAC